MRLTAHGNDGMLDEVKTKQAAHRCQVSVARTRLAAREALAVELPSFCLSMLIDGMDTGKTYTPKEGVLFLSSLSWFLIA